MKSLARQNGARGKVVGGVQRHATGELGQQTLSHGPRDRFNAVSLAKQDERALAMQRAHGRQHDGVEHRPGVGRRLADDAQNLRRRRLPLQRLPRLVEEPRVLHRNQRLRGEGPHERDLIVGEGTHFLAVEIDHARNGSAIA